MSKAKRTEITKLTRARKTTRNILLAKVPPWTKGDKKLSVANPEAAAMAQNVIDETADHVHLREARILLLFEEGKTPNADGQVELGRARKANPIVQLLGDRPDFIVKLNAETWDAFDPSQCLALMDHELTHCACTVAGRFVAEGKLDGFVKRLGKDLVSVQNDEKDDQGRVLVRYRKRDEKTGRLAWRIRRHDVEEFVAVGGRWGAWKEDLAHLALNLQAVDVMDKPGQPDPKMPLMAGAGGGTMREAACSGKAE